VIPASASLTARSSIVQIFEMAAKFLRTFKDYPASGTAGSFNLSKMQKQMEECGTVR
jgi:hypothetical protein